MITKKEYNLIKKEIRKIHFDFVSATGRISCDFLLKEFFKKLDKCVKCEGDENE